MPAPVGTNNTANVPQAYDSFYDRDLLDRAQPLLVANQFAQIRDIPQGNGNVVKFRKWGALALATTPLAEGVTPPGKVINVTDTTATVRQYGDYMILTDFVLMTSPDPVLTETAEVLGEQAGQTLDAIIMAVLAAGTAIFYAAARVSRITVAATDKISITELRQITKILKVNNAKKITRMVDPDTGYATAPVAPAYVGIIHPSTTFDLQALEASGFTPIEKYARSATDTMEGEIGKVSEIRFIETTTAPVFTGLGAAGIDVYGTLIMGRDAYGVTRISGESLKNIRKGTGEGGTSDPLNQRATSGWKATLAAVILQQLFMIRYEHATT